jgi:UDP-N-acetylmuramyl pentapeptide phosphotransferase/UDP-N-acetylglucosamine-1-phosphate transferase
VFLGDVGSSFLGYTFASLPLLVGRGSESPSWLPLAAVFFLWPFVFDSAFTFAKRLIKGERVWEPHRKHLYQMLIISGYSHSRVAFAYWAFGAISAVSFLVVIGYGGDVGLFPIMFLLSITISFVLAVFWFTRKTSNKKVAQSSGN